MFPFYQILETAAQLIGLFVIGVIVFGFFGGFIRGFKKGLSNSRPYHNGIHINPASKTPKPKVQLRGHSPIRTRCACPRSGPPIPPPNEYRIEGGRLTGYKCCLCGADYLPVKELH